MDTKPLWTCQHIRLKHCREGAMSYIVNDTYIGHALDKYGRRMRSAAAEGMAGLVAGWVTVNSASCAIGCACVSAHAARPIFLRPKFLALDNPSAKSLNSNGKVAYLSAANVVAVCEDGRPLSFFGATTPLGWPYFLSGVTGLSSLDQRDSSQGG
jgi:hypothetical protein